jgi:methionyl-tRNA formyltransferase
LKNNAKIIYLGTPAFAVTPLKAMVEAGYNVVAVVTNPDAEVGRKRVLTPPPVKEYALSVGIPVYQYRSIRKEGVKDMQAFGPVLMITCAFGQILSQEIIDIPTFGIYNLHGSLLPKYRGASPIQSAIIAGESVTGITVMKTDIGLDTGDVLLTKEVSIERETAGELFEKLSPVAAEALLTALPEILSGTPCLTPQNGKDATLTKTFKKEQALICWNASAKEIDCFVRGLNPWPVAFSYCKGEVVKIYFGTPLEEPSFQEESSSHAIGEIVRADKTGVYVQTAKGVYRIEKLQFVGGKPLTAAEAVNGRKIAVGDVFTAE